MEYEEIVLYDDDVDVDDFRNARGNIVDRRSRRRRTRRSRRPAGAIRGRIRRPAIHASAASAGPVIRDDTGGLSVGVLIEAGAQLLAAVQSLPPPPVASGETSTDVGNMILYQQALAEHAKKDEQLRTIGSIAAKLFA